MKELNIPEKYKNNVSIDRNNYSPLTGGKTYLSVSSGGLKVYFMVAYYIAILETAMEIGNNYHPHLLIMDSLHKNISTHHEVDRESIAIFYKKIIEIHEKNLAQIIIVDNELPEFIAEE